MRLTGAGASFVMTELLDVRAGAFLILRELRGQLRYLGAALVLGVIWSSARLAIPVLAGVTIDKAIREDRLDLLLVLSAAVILIAFVQGLAAAARRYCAMRTAHRVEANLRTALYNRVNRLSFDYYDRTATGQLMSRGSTDLHEIQQLVVMIPITSAFLLMAIGVFAVLMRVHMVLAVLAIGV